MPPVALLAFQYLCPGGNYGHVVLAAAALGTLAGAAGHSFVLGCFTDAIMEELALPRATVATCFMVSLVTSSVYANIVGAAADRVGKFFLWGDFLGQLTWQPYFFELHCASAQRPRHRAS